MVITFTVLTKPHPVGGAAALYEFANGMRRRGHSVYVIHIVVGDDQIRSVDEVTWFSFEEGIEHRYGIQELPEADFISTTRQFPRRHGLPFCFLQGYGVLPAWEDEVFRAPCPKVCIAKWLVDVAKEKGVDADQLVHVPYGLKHEKYRLVASIEGRPPLVSMVYRRHPAKGPGPGLAALAKVKKRIPELEAVVFSTQPPAHEIPPWMTFLSNPSQEAIVNEIYNRSRVFLCSSAREGFGFPCIEAMACGAALVTTSNGGSDDYAIDGETALVCGPGDSAAMANRIETLLRDEDQRIGLAKRGGEFVRETFDWDVSAEKLERFLNAYAADPDAHLPVTESH